MTGFVRAWGAFKFWMVGECVEFEAIFSHWLVFWRDVVEGVESQSFEGENGLDF